MNMISQHSAVSSLDEALVPGEHLIDGRTERDRLWFMSAFAELINFYDQNNSIQGNWKPFLLKDPVFLTACMSKTPFSYYYSLYKESCLKIENPDFYSRDLTDKCRITDRFFIRFHEVFEQIACWTHFMNLKDESYDLKKYVIDLVKAEFSPLYWALKSLRERLFLIARQNRVNYERLYSGGYFHEKLWVQNRGGSSFKEVLGLDPNFEVYYDDSTYDSCYTALVQAGGNLFNFFNTIIDHSNAAFLKLCKTKSPFPDTALLRTFVNLLQIQQEQLNGLAKKHLQFYYRDILKQHALPAKPDKAFICASLMSTTEVFHLEAGTSFEAGTDEKNSPVIFNTGADETLQPATIVSAVTVSRITSPGSLEKPESTSLFLTPVTGADKLQYAEDGQLKSWATFGEPLSAASSIAKVGIAFGSPMLYLKEAERTIKITFELVEGSPVLPLNFADMLKKADFYLSTATDWLYVKPIITEMVEPIFPFYNNRIILFICLDYLQPAITAFSANPDGYDCAWPMLKIMFNDISVKAVHAFIKSMKIETEAEGLQHFQLYNDTGEIDAKTPYPAFGAIPLQNSNFIIGSSEIFSKPFYSFSLKLDWDNLPADLQQYYQLYNDYIHPAPPPLKKENKKKAVEKKQDDPVRKSFWSKLLAALLWLIKFPARLLKSLFRAIQKMLTGIWLLLVKLYRFIINEIEEIYKCQPFNNSSFITDFRLLQGARWVNFPMTAPPVYPPVSDPPPVFTYLPDKYIPGGCLPQNPNGQFLFRVKESVDLFGFTSWVLSGKSFFEIGAGQIPDLILEPSIQQSPLLFTDSSSSGFMRMTLTGPDLGFGSTVYAAVVSNIALHNARFVMKPNGPLVNPANLPFVPAVKGISAHYKASCRYDLTKPATDYPLRIVLYSPFTNYTAYDNTSPAQVNKSLYDNFPVPFFPAFNYSGAMFIELANLIPGNTLNLYFHLSRLSAENTEKKKIYYCYLSANGWRKLPVLEDGTCGFGCSGIIKFNIPADISNETPFMKGKNYWISVAVKSDAASFSSTVYLNTNGIEVIRGGTDYLRNEQVPHIVSNSIIKPYNAVPQIAAVAQPFDSFGGKAAENTVRMNERVSARISTKDRSIAPGDYYTMISREFDHIYYSKLITSEKKDVKVLLVKKAESYSAPGAFLPFTTECEEIEIKKFLQKKISPFTNCDTSNFKPEYVTVTITVTLKQGYKKSLVEQEIDMALNIYLAPWINSDRKQAIIDTEIYNAGVADCIGDIEGVGNVIEVKFTTWIYNTNSRMKDQEKKDVASISPLSPSYIFVPSLENRIIWKAAV